MSLLPRVWLEGVSLSVSLDPGVGASSLPPLRRSSLTAMSQSTPSPSNTLSNTHNTSPVSGEEDTDPLSQTSPPAREDASGGVPGADVGGAQEGGDHLARGASDGTCDAAGDDFGSLAAEPSGASATPDTWRSFADDDDAVDSSVDGHRGTVDGSSGPRRPKL